MLFGTPDTANELADGESYENVTVARPLGPANWQLLQYIQNDIQPSTVSGDCILCGKHNVENTNVDLTYSIICFKTGFCLICYSHS